MAGLEHDLDGVEAIIDVVALEEFQVTAGGVTEGFLLVGADGLDGATEVIAGAGADFDEDEGVLVATDQVDFAADDEVVFSEDFVAVASQKSRGNALTIVPDLLRCRQRRRRRARGSVETIYDGLG